MSTFKLPSRLTLVVHLLVALAMWATVSVSGCSSSASNGPSDGGVDSSTVGDGTFVDTTSNTCQTPKTSCSGTCVNTTNDPDNCGSCGATCGGGLVCSSSKCSVGCGTGQTLCNAGTCTNTQTDFDNCGGCGKACQPGQVCSAGMCTGFCSAPNTSCGGSCVDTASDPSNCGSCGKACGTGLICNGGNCVSSCGTLTSCATEAGTFCTNTQNDNTNCGTCGTVCPGGEVCSQGMCQLTCQAGTVDCNNKCIDPTSDPTNCGATTGCGVGGTGSAGTACGSGQACAGGVCSISCPAGQVACGASCIDPTSNGAHCGATAGCGAGDAGTAGVTCGAGLVCSSGSCQANCGGGLVLCTVNGTPTCVDPKTNPGFCGATTGCGVADAGTAGQVCAQGNVCSNGTCGLTCQTGQLLCNGVCINPQSDPNHCGAILGSNCQGINGGLPCQQGHVCVNGSCAVSCIPGQVNCQNTCIDPLTNNEFCGASTVNCQTYTTCASGNVCEDGGCVLTCQMGLVNCDGTCIDPTSDPTYCNANGTCSNCSAAANSGNHPCACASGKVCNGATPPNAVCSLSCLGTEAMCGSPASCINPNTDSTYCGAAAGGTCIAGKPLGDPNYPGVNCPNTTKGSSCNGSGLCVCPTASGAAGPDAVCGGVCTDGLTSPTNCGAAPGGTCSTIGQSNSVGTNAMGVDCESVNPGSSCVGGVCTCPNIPGMPAGNPEPICGGACVDPTTNTKYCGAQTGCTTYSTGGGDCTQISGATCSSSKCGCPPANGSTPAQVACPTGGSPPSACIDPSTNNTYCNASGDCTGGNRGSVCGPLSACGSDLAHAGQYTCNDSCATDQLQCDAGAGAPYCASYKTDNSNCGACHTACPGLTTCEETDAAGTPSTGYGCVDTCPSPEIACPPVASGPNPNAYYCANLSTDSNNCGTTVADCNHQCPAGTPLCSNGICSSSCGGVDTACPAATGTPNAPNPPNPYCADTQSDVGNCGGCGTAGFGTAHVCQTSSSDTSHVCLQGQCCSSTDNAICSNACTDTSSSTSHCGSCTNSCSGGQFCMGGACGLHHDGEGDTWHDATPQATYSLAEATTACQTYASAHGFSPALCETFPSCSADVGLECFCPTAADAFVYLLDVTASTDLFWFYAGADVADVVTYTFTASPATCAVSSTWN